MDINDENIKQLYIDLKNDFQKNINEIQNIIQINKEQWIFDLTKLFNTCFINTLNSQQENCKGKLRYISFSILLTSILTEKYSFGINFYDENFYLDESNIFDEFFLEYISDFIDKDMESIKIWLRNKQILFNKSDLFEMKNIMVLNYMAIWIKHLKDEIIYCLNQSKIDDIILSEKIDITFGTYLEKQAVMIVWEV